MLVILARVKVVVVVVSALALAAGLLTLALQAKPAQAQAGTITSTDQSTFSGTFFTCTGELVFIEGTVNTVAHTTIDANGERHTVSRFNIQGQGVSDSGAKYVFIDVFNFTVNSEGGAPYYNVIFTQTVKLIRQGSATPTDDLDVNLLIHQTVNAQGELTAEILEFESVCT